MIGVIVLLILLNVVNSVVMCFFFVVCVVILFWVVWFSVFRLFWNNVFCVVSWFIMFWLFGDWINCVLILEMVEMEFWRVLIESCYVCSVMLLVILVVVVVIFVLVNVSCVVLLMVGRCFLESLVKLFCIVWKEIILILIVRIVSRISFLIVVNSLFLICSFDCIYCVGLIVVFFLMLNMKFYFFINWF